MKSDRLVSLPPGRQELNLVEITDFADVNALSEDCSIKVGPNLTLVYGANGSGKSGIGRLLCNACFSRGEREILPNARADSETEGEARATFVIQTSDGHKPKSSITLVTLSTNSSVLRSSTLRAY